MYKLSCVLLALSWRKRLGFGGCRYTYYIIYIIVKFSTEILKLKILFYVHTYEYA